MRKFLFVFTALVMATSFSEAAMVKSLTIDPTPRVTVAQFEAMTGKKMNFLQKFFFKIAAKKASKAKDSEGKSQLVAVLLCFFLGGLGIHRFYLGYTWQGIVQLLTLGGFGIWALIDFIRILIGDLKPKDGEYAKTL